MPVHEFLSAHTRLVDFSSAAVSSHVSVGCSPESHGLQLLSGILDTSMWMAGRRLGLNEAQENCFCVLFSQICHHMPVVVKPALCSSLLPEQPERHGPADGLSQPSDTSWLCPGHVPRSSPTVARHATCCPVSEHGTFPFYSEVWRWPPPPHPCPGPCPAALPLSFTPQLKCRFPRRLPG